MVIMEMLKDDSKLSKLRDSFENSRATALSESVFYLTDSTSLYRVIRDLSIASEDYIKELERKVVDLTSVIREIESGVAYNNSVAINNLIEEDK